MIKVLQNELSINVIASIIVSLLFLAAGFEYLENYVRLVRLIGKFISEHRH